MASPSTTRRGLIALVCLICLSTGLWLGLVLQHHFQQFPGLASSDADLDSPLVLLPRQNAAQLRESTQLDDSKIDGILDSIKHRLPQLFKDDDDDANITDVLLAQQSAKLGVDVEVIPAAVPAGNGDPAKAAADARPRTPWPRFINQNITNAMQHSSLIAHPWPKDEPPYGAPPDENPKKDPKLYCYVLTFPKRHDPKAIAVNQTWGARFDELVFMTTEHFPGLNTAILDIKEESRAMLWPKTKLAWLHTYKNYVNDYDWFMKADDDTFVMVDNLRRFLSKYDPDKPHFFGRRFLLHRGEGPDRELSYYSGGAGYVLSRGALRKLGENHEYAFKTYGTAEDVEMARAMKRIGIECEDSRDEEGRERFLPLNIDHLRYKYTFENKPTFWYWRYSYYPPRDRLDCCSKRWISTHYIYSQDLYRIEKLYMEGKDGCGQDPLPPYPKYPDA